MEEMVTIPMKEYEALRKREDKLACLEAAGVDNWQGYDDAMDMLDDLNREPEENIKESNGN